MKPEPLVLGLATSAIVGILAALVLPSCSNIPAGVIQPGTQGYVTQLGGKVKLSTAHANLDIDNVESFKDGTKTINNGIFTWGLTKITDIVDGNATDVDKANIDAQSKASSEKAANAATKEANRHTEALTKMEIESVPTP